MCPVSREPYLQSKLQAAFTSRSIYNVVHIRNPDAFLGMPGLMLFVFLNTFLQKHIFGLFCFAFRSNCIGVYVVSNLYDQLLHKLLKEFVLAANKETG